MDTSAVVDFLLGLEAAPDVRRIIRDEGQVQAPDVLLFETLAVLRRDVLRGDLDARRAAEAVDDLGDVRVAIAPTLPLCARAWELRRNLTVADAMFVALAEHLGEPLATKDRPLAKAASAHVPVMTLGA